MKPLLILLSILISNVCGGTTSSKPVNGAELKKAVSEWIEPGVYAGYDCTVEITATGSYFIIGLYADSGQSVYISANTLTSFKDVSLYQTEVITRVESRLDDCVDGVAGTSVDSIIVARNACSPLLTLRGFHRFYASELNPEPSSSWSQTCTINPNDPLPPL